jgi:hypothetical protein
MKDTSTSRGAAVTRRAYDQVQPKTRARTLSRLFPAALFLCLGAAVNLHGQQLPPDPGAVGSQCSSSITGTVRDGGGLPLVGIEARLLGQNNHIDAKQATDSNGIFTFTDLPAGIYQVKVDVPGHQPFASEPLAVAAGTRHELPAVVMRMVTKATTIDVNASLQEVAEAQVKQEQTQRLLGFFPNYYTSYIWDAAPMSPKLKFGMAFRTVTDPVSLLVVAGLAGAEQYHNTFPGYGQGAEGYAKRLGSTYADTVASRMLGSAVFPVLLHQDPRYFYRGSGTVRSRLAYAVVSAVVARGDNGQLQPNYSHILGSFAAAGISNLYKSPQDRQVGLTLRNGLIITAAAAGVNIMREFVFRNLTPGVPAFQNGKP